MAEKKPQSDPLDAMATDHDPNTTGRVRLTEAQTIENADGTKRRLAPGTPIRVSAEEAVKAVDEDPAAAVPWGQTHEIATAQREAQQRIADEGEAPAPRKRRAKAEE